MRQPWPGRIPPQPASSVLSSCWDVTPLPCGDQGPGPSAKWVSGVGMSRERGTHEQPHLQLISQHPGLPTPAPQLPSLPTESAVLSYWVSLPIRGTPVPACPSLWSCPLLWALQGCPLPSSVSLGAFVQEPEGGQVPSPAGPQAAACEWSGALSCCQDERACTQRLVPATPSPPNWNSLLGRGHRLGP